MASNSNTPPQTLMTHMLQNPWEAVQFAMRSTALVCSIGFFFMGLGVSMGSAYQLYLIVMATSFIAFTIKLYLRAKEQQISFFSRAFLQFFPAEDSGHYLIYTLLLYNQPPTTIFVLPMFLYSILFTVKYIQRLVQFLPMQSYINVLLRTIASKQADIHRFIAFCEVFIIIVLTWKVFTSGVFILAPFLYYQFLKLRYSSRRNPSVRTVFAELHMSAEYAASHPRCPPFVANVIRKVVFYISRLNPNQVAAPPPNTNTTNS